MSMTLSELNFAGTARDMCREFIDSPEGRPEGMGPSSLLWYEGISGGLRVVLPVNGCARVCGAAPDRKREHAFEPMLHSLSWLVVEFLRSPRLCAIVSLRLG